MKRFMFVIFTFIALPLIAQDTTLSTVVIPSGFDFWYLAIFGVGMIGHFAVHVIKTGGGWKTLFTNFWAQFVGWFFNKYHLTLFSGAAAAIIGTAAQLGLDVPFATLNALGIATAIAAGYIADSAFNNGTPAVQRPKVE